MDILSKILDSKRLRLAASMQAKPLEKIRAQALAARAGAKSHNLIAALSRKNTINIIAEFKRRSPSKGIINADVSLESVARAYEAGGAAAISVLTEEDFFAGSLEDLRAVKRTTQLPVLRKDFIFDAYQVYESAVAGADALLLIAAALDDERLVRLRKLAEDELGLDALVEVHTEGEMHRVLKSGATLIGINNRDLKTFEVSIETSIKLAAMVGDRVLVSESGFNSTADLIQVRAAGVNAFLIGESLMRAEDPATALRSLIEEDNSRWSNEH